MEEEVQDKLLPSEESEVQTDDDYLKNNIHENGRIFGKFKNVQEAFEYYRKQEVTHTNNMREIKESIKGQEIEDQKAIEDAQTEIKRNQTLLELVPKFVENGRKLDDELISKAKEVGLSQTDIELGSYKLNEAISAAHSVVGGEEEYNNMIAWAVDNIDQETRDEFDIDVAKLLTGKKSVGKLAIEGMYARYKSGAKVETEGDTRVYGDNPSTNSNAGYKTQADMIRDKRAADRSGDPTLINRYREKLARTPDTVVFGR